MIGYTGLLRDSNDGYQLVLNIQELHRLIRLLNIHVHWFIAAETKNGSIGSCELFLQGLWFWIFMRWLSALSFGCAAHFLTWLCLNCEYVIPNFFWEFAVLNTSEIVHSGLHWPIQDLHSVIMIMLCVLRISINIYVVYKLHLSLQFKCSSAFKFWNLVHSTENQKLHT